MIIGTPSLLSAYESEAKLQTVIVGKVAKFVQWDRQTTEPFVITVLNDSFDGSFEKIYNGKQIKGRPVIIKNLTDISNLTETDVLFIPKNRYNHLNDIFQSIRSKKDILIIGSGRGFAERGGIVEIYFASQKARLRINRSAYKRAGLKIKPSLLHIADIVQM